MLIIDKIMQRKILNVINLKKYFLIFIGFFTFITALGIYYSIYNSADSNPELVSFFLILGLISFFTLFFIIINEIIKLFINIKNKTAGSILQKKIVGVFALIAITPVLIVAIFVKTRKLLLFPFLLQFGCQFNFNKNFSFFYIVVLD